MAKAKRAPSKARKVVRQVAGDHRGRDLVARIPDLTPAHVMELTGDAYIPCPAALDRASRLLRSASAGRVAVLTGVATGDVRLRLMQGGQLYFPTAAEQARVVLKLDDSTATWTGDRIGLARPVRLAFFDDATETEIHDPGDPVTIDTRGLNRYCQEQIAASAPVARSAGGRPRKPEWRALDFEACCWLDIEGTLDAEACLCAHLDKYAAEQLGTYPDARELRELARAAIKRWTLHCKSRPA
jgi:hypothetical protein